ncbi:ADAMTS-like protein 4 isoform X2 [Alligator mississippiensis]|uniref:ADAMTS-like protein 4 isoform X2 n=1 Tax=Alligator mississippiensis TaxID=8496 RepID=UPI0009073435|nr:ADAMTS-like protein 4 isoform X2 [Alligator mississippiensis]
MGTPHGVCGRLRVAALSLTLPLLLAQLCHSSHKVPPRTSRQAPEEDGTGPRVPGVWGSWGPWSSCSQPCGPGVSERTRVCQPPLLPPPPPAAWAGGGTRRPAPPFQEEWAGTYPLHTDGGPALPPRYSPPPRYTRHEELPAAPLRRPPPALDDSSGHGLAPVPRRPPSRAPARSVIPLFKPEVGDRPRHSSMGHSRTATPTQVAGAARRSQTRDTIKPGKYGYGKVPFALPLHREEGAPRLRRHPGPPLPAKKPKRKAGLAAARQKPASNMQHPARGPATPLTKGGVELGGPDVPRGSGQGEIGDLGAAVLEPQGRAGDEPGLTGLPGAEAGTGSRGQLPGNHSSLPQPRSGGIHKGVLNREGPDSGRPPPPARPRVQRQDRPRAGTRMTHSLYVDQPVPEPDTWLRHHPIPSAGHSPPDTSRWNLYSPGTESLHCEGESQQHKACQQESCPPSQPDPRALQCAAFNSQEFMGRLYQWEPFTDVWGAQRCELNCRPVGYRFYVRHTEAVRDGAPCQPGTPGICVAGRCLSPGCDGVLGSNRTLDACGVCGGDGSTCRLVSGNFSDRHVPIGYHRILRLPAGATHIRLAQRAPSPNYLALRSRAGKSLINGNWAVDPPGRYEAGGTVFTYARPSPGEQRGGETLTADGPTAEPLDVYIIFQQDNPGISYQYFVAVPRPESPQPQFGALTVVSPSETLELPTPPAPVPARPPGTLQRNVRVPPLPPPATGPHGLYWKRVGSTPCSASCGTGSWKPLFRCAWRHSHEELEDERCHGFPRPPAPPEPCNTQPCPAYWAVGEWSACSRSCGPGTQHRQVLCRQSFANRSTTVPAQRCAQLPRPSPSQACQAQPCSHWECSVPCGLGQRSRHVRCVSDQGDVLSDGECQGSHRPSAREACDMGPCQRAWFHSSWSDTCSAECGPGIQRRAVVCLSSPGEGPTEESCVGTRPPDMRACNSGPCQRLAHWYTGPWNQCSAECGTGTQRRDVICVTQLGADFNVTGAADCAPQPRPPTLQPCIGTSCRPRWFSTSWSACSKSCEGGVQVREVQCLTPNRTLSNRCPPELQPPEKRVCNTQPCAPELDESCQDKHPNCVVVVQARLCVYAYYQAVCCAACARTLTRRQAPPAR